MTVTLTATQVYLGIIVFLIVLQVVQWYAIRKLQEELKQVWGQMTIIAVAVSHRLLNDKQEVKQENQVENRD